MRPLTFGAEGRRLYGVYHPAVGRGRGGRAYVLCAPFGAEALRSHRAMRVLADTLARDHAHVLRFDYFGVGDSDGADDAGELGGWVADVGCAVDEVRALSGARRVILVGLRLGASLAALAAASRADVAGLVLWDPVADGERWLGEVARDAVHEASGTLYVDGVPIAPSLGAGLRTLTPEGLAEAAPERVLSLVTVGREAQAPLKGALASRRPGQPWEEVDAPSAWEEQAWFGPGAVPAAVIRRIAEWQG